MMFFAALTDLTRPNGPVVSATIPPGTSYSTADVAQVAKAAGFAGYGLTMAVAISRAEDGSGDTQIINAYGDRGLWQINRHYHPEVSDECALSPLCAAQAAYRISNGGSNWSAWTTYQNGSYLLHLAEAKAVT